MVENVSVTRNIGFHLDQWADIATATQFFKFDFMIDEIVAAGQD